MVLGLLLALTQAQAVTLNPIPPANVPAYSGTPTVPTCDQLKARLDTLNANLVQHGSAMGSYLQNVEDAARSWYALLQPLEGQTQLITKGTFSPINSGASDIDNLNQMVSTSYQYLQDDLTAIETGVLNCSKISDRR